MENHQLIPQKMKSSRFLKSPLKIHPAKLLPSLLSSNEMNNSAVLFHDSPSQKEQGKTPVVKRFTVPDLIKSKSNRSLSPVMKFRIDERETEKKIFEKYRVKRVEDQDREIHLMQLGNHLKENVEKGGSEDEKIAMSLEIIKNFVS